MYSVFSDYFLFMGKGELLKWPFFRLFFRTMDIPVHRGNDRESWKSLRRAGEAIDEGACIALYPEGTIPTDAPRMKSFKNGAFRLSQEKNIPVVPVTWIQNSKILRDPEKPFEPSLPGIVRVKIHHPVYPPGTSGEDLIALRTSVFRVIDSALPPEFRKYHDH